MNTDLITRIEEHVIDLQDRDVRSQHAEHVKTIELLREVKDEMHAIDARETFRN